MTAQPPLYFLRKVRQQLKPPWLDTTDWSKVLVSSLATENEFVKRSLSNPVDNLARAAACAAVLEATEQPMTHVVAPLRVGKIATDSVSTFRQLLHTAAAGHYALESTASTNTSVEKMRAAGTAWRHLVAAGTWQHEHENCPPQLLPAFREALQLIVLLLSVAALQDKSTPYKIKLLQGIYKLSPPSSEMHRWAAASLREAMAMHWAVKHTDVRKPDADPNVMMAYAVCCELGDCGNETVAQFLRMASSVGGMTGLVDARQELAQQGGAAGLMEPPRDILDSAMPYEVLNNGETSLTRAELLQTGMATGGTQVLHQSSPGVVLFTSKVPALPKISAEQPSSRWWTPRLPSIPRSIVSVTKLEPAAPSNSIDFL